MGGRESLVKLHRKQRWTRLKLALAKKRDLDFLDADPPAGRWSKGELRGGANHATGGTWGARLAEPVQVLDDPGQTAEGLY